MNHDDRSAIDTLFSNLATVERQMPNRDAEAERVIREALDRQPSAAYYMAQTVIMQQKALETAQKRIEDLEARPASAPASAEPARRGGFFSGFGGGSVPKVSRNSPFQNHSSSPFQNRGGGGGFLAGAAQTAMGVAGGVLLGNALAGMFGGGAMAGEAPEDTPQDEAQTEEAPAEDNADWDNDSGAYDDGGYDEGE
ncbi:DUF2076 domain-containing protein [Falsirhodobacter sp. 20TX0035]|uniref:DUF2076 domain-containing protein n=1 Tax=Falsirhodobacter sp. 20TX0035 TaxID=3022019 RepID=UPI00232C30D7|nr:DUF2076 family protein [Falsirhodobacter sp. 20TX0035]MDB6454038.1 DUF2076 family protein [Falsirhodobacter sp. 20TX0035]